VDARTATARLLHDDHRRMLGMIERVESFLARHGEDRAPDLVRDAEARALLAALDGELGRDVDGHFVFEEQALFPLLAAAGAHELPVALAAEHDAMRGLARRLRQICQAALRDGFEPEDWTLFRLFVTDLIDRQVAHLETEEIALLHLVDELLSPEQDRELAAVLASSGPRPS
jgi:iron-sulfur cluster repair protein YtfE (RIC family)